MGLKEKSSLVREALKALIERESARRLALLAGFELFGTPPWVAVLAQKGHPLWERWATIAMRRRAARAEPVHQAELIPVLEAGKKLVERYPTACVS